MAYEKKSIGANEEVKPYLDGLEGRVDSAFGDIKDYVVDSGSHTRGEWEKWASGKMVQYGAINSYVLANQSAGILYISDQASIYFPVPFSSIKSVSPSLATHSNIGGVTLRSFDTSKMEIRFWSSSKMESSYNYLLNYIAIGRWK